MAKRKRKGFSPRRRPIIGITMGDAAGIGSEILVKTCAKKEIYKLASPLVIGDRGILTSEIKKQKAKIKINSVSSPAAARFRFGIIDLIDLKNISSQHLKIGKLNKTAARAAVAYIKEAVSLAVAGEIDALVTAPVNKEALRHAGFKFSGHTELLARLTKTKNYSMMLVGGPLKVVLVTAHLPLRKVSDSLTKVKVYQTIRLARESMRYFGLRRPRIGVAGLNPHAGEGGIFGREETKFIAPAVEKARKEGVKIEGPIAPDTIFHRALKGEFDVIIAMYHDQGLIPLKMLAFEEAVNITLGLPIIRTSVGHGTAYDIAGKGEAKAASLVEAVRVAAALAKARKV
jgi:4-hydroxythreonine-4-phosphate dehydrogenase